MTTQTKPWEVVSFLTPSHGLFWQVRRDRFAGCDYLMTTSGNQRRFRKQATAQAAANAANKRATDDANMRWGG